MIERQQMARMVNVDASDRNQARIFFQMKAIDFTVNLYRLSDYQTNHRPVFADWCTL
jgi:hypothetical protein